MNNKTHYEILGVKEDASFDEIKKAYIALIKMYHPDRAPEGKYKEYETKTISLNKAKEILLDEGKRSAYDLELYLNKNNLFNDSENYDIPDSEKNSENVDNFTNEQNVEVDEDELLSNLFNQKKFNLPSILMFWYIILIVISSCVVIFEFLADLF